MMNLLPKYTIWYKVKGQEEAELLEDEGVFSSSKKAFKRAEELAKQSIYSGCYILVRKIKLGSEMCLEWEFDCDSVE